MFINTRGTRTQSDNEHCSGEVKQGDCKPDELGRNTVNSYRQTLYKANHTKNTAELIAFTFKNGLLIELLPQ